MMINEEYLKGRGAQFNTDNPFRKQSYVEEHIEGLDEPLLSNDKTQFTMEYPKTIVNEVKSPDIGMMYSLNAYQGCEHGCAYCYARNVHMYWGLSAGLDFERKIIVKPEAPALLEELLKSKKWKAVPISMSGNTDCYQPAERKYELTRKLLEVFLRYRHPVSIITKNSLILRDLDLLRELASLHLVKVMVSVTGLNEDLRMFMEPRTASYKKRIQTIEKLNASGIDCGVMNAPIIPGLNSEEVPSVLKAAGEAGAVSAGFTIVRLNGAVKDIFHDWLYTNFPDRADKVWHQVEACHGGKVNDTQWGRRISGSGQEAEAIGKLFDVSESRYITAPEKYELDCSLYKNPNGSQQLSLFS
jgi:DNA repair photolyase